MLRERFHNINFNVLSVVMTIMCVDYNDDNNVETLLTIYSNNEVTVANITKPSMVTYSEVNST